MLSPKMQRAIRVNDNQLVMLAERAHYDCTLTGHLHKRTADSTKWQLRWFVLYQNLLFYYESEHGSRPSGVILLEGSYCERLITTSAKNKDAEKPYCFAISYRREGQRIYELRANSETDLKTWLEALREASFNKLLLQKEELEQKHLHLLQIVESEKTAKWQYTQQCEELTSEIKKLRAELCALKKEWRPVTYNVNQSTNAVDNAGTTGPPGQGLSEDSAELRKIKKVQSFFRGWLCRRRWKQIVEQYIKSPHAESMRKRNSLVFRMVEAEEEYMEQMEVLVSCFLRPFKMAASSKKPPCSHEDVNSIFLNSETVLFLHQIFLKGLTSRMESWPTLVLGDLFDMLLPMLSIYQEYVRNHHYSLQVLTECKQSPPFANLLARLENKPACYGRSLETFLTYPMHQVPRYIITLHEILAHTPHDHVERKSLMNARQQLEDLSRQMHDEVSETENLRKNLAVERMIVEGCDILLDVNQVFVRQGSLLQIPSEKSKTPRGRLPSFKSEKEALRQCFLFSNHLIIATRTSGGKLHLVPEIGKIPLADALLIEDPSDHGNNNDEDESSVCSTSSQSSENSSSCPPLQNRDFKIIVDIKGGNQGQTTVHLAAPTLQEKAAWVSDISQCMDNVHFNDFIHGSISDTSSVSMPQSIKNDPKLFKDDVDIRFSRTLNSCKVPQIRYATPERLLERLTDLRFLSIDFLNTFLLTYRVFTDGVQVLEALKKVFYNAEPVDKPPTESMMSLMEGMGQRDDNTLGLCDPQRRNSCVSPRRVSAASSVSGYGSEMSDRDRSHSYDSQCHAHPPARSHWRCSYRKFEEEQRELALIKEGAPGSKTSPTGGQISPRKTVTIRVESEEDNRHLTVPTTMNPSSSAETLTDLTVVSAPSSPSNLSTVTLVGSDNSNTENQEGKGEKSKDTADADKQEEEEEKDPETPKVKTFEESQVDDDDQEGLRDFDNDDIDNKNDDAFDQDNSEESNQELEHLYSRLEEDDDPFDYKSKDTRRGSMKKLNEVGRKSDKEEEEEEAKRKKSVDESGTSKEQISKKESSGFFHRDSKKSSSGKKDKPEEKKSESKTERIAGRFSDGFLTVENKGRRQRSKSAERRSRPVFRRKGSEGFIVTSEMKRKGSDVSAISRDGSIKSTKRKNSDKSSQRSWTRSWGSKRKNSSGSPHRRGTDLEFSDESGSEWAATARSASISTTNSMMQSYYSGRRDTDVSSACTSQRASFQHDSPQNMSKAGVVITSFRQSQRSNAPDPLWSSTSAAAAAFAIATSASSNPRERASVCSTTCSVSRGRASVGDASLRAGVPARDRGRKESSIISTPATMRVLNVLRHWVSKHAQDFESDQRLKNLTIEFLEDITYSPNLLPAEHKAVNQLLRLITKEDPESSKVNLDVLLAPPLTQSKESIETLSALEIAEQITYIDHQIFISINSEEFLGQAWMKADKAKKAPHILLMTKRFNEVSQLVVSEIVRRSNLSARVAAIEKWAAVADISRCLHNFNGVLQICAAFTNSAVFRLKKTWEKVSKTTKQTIERLQTIVSSDSRFRNLRDALHRCDPPCIPYLGMYLTDLSFIEEGTPNFTDDGLLNFSKMRMIAHVIREIKLFQQSRYKIECIPKVTNYLLDTSLMMDDEELYQMSLELEPRVSRLGSTAGILPAPPTRSR